MHLTLKQLTYFVAIVDAGNMSLAAERLHVSPTALSLQVKSLEEQLAVSLFHRHSRGVSPTDSGVVLYRKAQEILALVDQTERGIAETRPAPIPPLRLGLQPSAARNIGLDAMLGIGDRGKGPVLQVIEDWSPDLLVRVEAGDLDFAIIRSMETPEGFRAVDVVEEQLVFATSPGKQRDGGSIGFAEAAASGLILCGAPGTAGIEVLAKARDLGLPVTITHRVQSVDLMRDLIRRGIANAITPHSSVEAFERHGEIAVHEIEDATILRRLSLVARTEVFEAGIESGLVDRLLAIVASSYSQLGPHYRCLAPDRTALVAAQ